MYASVILAIFSPVIWLFVSTIWCLIRNYTIARKVGLPILIVPICPQNPVWMLLARHILPIIQYIPFGNGNFSRFCHVGWEFDEKFRAHAELGDAFMFCTPGKNWIYLCDSNTVLDIIRRERQGVFGRPVELLAMLDVFGPNISTAQGQDWQRQRKSTAVSFNEQSNILVWSEALRQGQNMVEYWKSSGANGVRTTAQDVKTLALNVLAYAGLGKKFDFEGTRNISHPDGPFSYRDALRIILDNAILVFALGPGLLKRLSFMRKLRQVSNAITQLNGHMANMIDVTPDVSKSEGARGNLLHSLAKSVEEKRLSREEVVGNMFVYNFAGHDTTSHAFAHTFLLLAAHPEVQEWMSEEIHHVTKDVRTDELSYELYPRLVRTLAVFYETLRLYDPLLSIVKGTEDQPTLLKIGNKEYMVPQQTRVIINLNGLHRHPRYWGDDAYEWKPSRWIKETPGNGNVLDREVFCTADEGTYMAWSKGMRSCPGEKFSQVEHVAVMVSLFREHIVEPMRERGEDREAARLRVTQTVADTGMRLLLQLLHPERVALAWKHK